MDTLAQEAERAIAAYQTAVKEEQQGERKVEGYFTSRKNYKFQFSVLDSDETIWVLLPNDRILMDSMVYQMTLNEKGWMVSLAVLRGLKVGRILKDKHVYLKRDAQSLFREHWQKGMKLFNKEDGTIDMIKVIFEYPFPFHIQYFLEQESEYTQLAFCVQRIFEYLIEHDTWMVPGTWMEPFISKLSEEDKATLKQYICFPIKDHLTFTWTKLPKRNESEGYELKIEENVPIPPYDSKRKTFVCDPTLTCDAVVFQRKIPITWIAREYELKDYVAPKKRTREITFEELKTLSKEILLINNEFRIHPKFGRIFSSDLQNLDTNCAEQVCIHLRSVFDKRWISEACRVSRKECLVFNGHLPN